MLEYVFCLTSGLFLKDPEMVSFGTKSVLKD